MPPIVVNGKQIAETILQSLPDRIVSLKQRGITPALAVVLAGDDQPSRTYVTRKGEVAQQLGVNFFRFNFPENILPDDLLKEIKRIQDEHTLSGMIIQLPLPESLGKFSHEIINAIDTRLDVDCLTDASLGQIMLGANPLPPPTPAAVLEIFRYHHIEMTGVRVVIVGRGNLIGKPLANLLLNMPVTLTVCGRNTKELSFHTRHADIIITGVGKAALITGDMVQSGVAVIDGGTVFVDGKIQGDVEFASVAPKSALITPVPGGVGPITIAKLLENTVTNAERMCQI